jgi:NAD+ diphosphatase
MLGYQAQAASRSISLIDNELEDACWLNRKQISEGLATGQFQLPTDISISFRLIEDWYNRIDGASLRTLRNRYHKDG